MQKCTLPLTAAFYSHALQKHKLLPPQSVFRSYSTALHSCLVYTTALIRIQSTFGLNLARLQYHLLKWMELNWIGCIYTRGESGLNAD